MEKKKEIKKEEVKKEKGSSKKEKVVESTKKMDVSKKTKKEKKKVNLNYLWIMLGSLVILFAVTVVFTGILAFKYTDEISEYVNEHFVSSEEESNTQQLVVTESEKNIISIVEENESSVVSIAVSELSFSQTEGLVDIDSNIGTGFIVDTDGIIATNQHVVSDETADYTVVTSDGDEYDVVEIVRDDVNDIALLKVDATELNAVDLGDSDNLAVGQTVIAIGTPLGEYSGSVTGGIISGLDRSVTASSDWFGSTSKTYENVIQTDAAVNPGNSGGPLINSMGDVVGMNFATTSDADNISFALPINKVKQRLEEYITYGKFIKPYLGVSYQMISDYQALYYSNVVQGALVVRLDADGPAYEAGIEKGDIISSFDGESVTSSLSQMIQEHEVGETVDVEIYRDGEELTKTVTLIEAD